MPELKEPFDTLIAPFPQAIDETLPIGISARAAELIGGAMALCQPFDAGTVLARPNPDAFRVFIAQCKEFKGGLPVDEGELSADARSFDEFFGIHRSRSPDALPAGIAIATAAAIDELSLGHSLAPGEVADLALGFQRLIDEWPRGGERNSCSPAVKTSRLRPRRDPLQRWRKGHWIFVIQIEGQILLLRKAAAAFAREDTVLAVESLRGVCILLRASAAAMRLAGDLKRADYELVRARMTPPLVPEGFSGLFNEDHRELLRLIKQARPYLRLDRPELSRVQSEFLLSLNAAYAAHRYVCQRVTGSLPSIASASRSSEKPAHESLRSFARRTLDWAGYHTKERQP
jgi:hypothetical protein